MPYKTYQQPASRKSGRKGAADESADKEEKMDIKQDMDDDTEMADESVENGDKKKGWMKRTKEGGVIKTPKDVQRRRRNYRLKKLLTPKAPVMILNELLGQAKTTYEIDEPEKGAVRDMAGMFTARTVYDGKGFTGMGSNKAMAKNICAESVLQYLVTKSCQESEGKENNENVKANMMETDTPWVGLASLALYKMFNDWQSQGFQIPVDMMKEGSVGQLGHQKTEKTQDAQAAAPKKEKAAAAPKKEKAAPAGPKADKQLPDNPLEKHPVQLLNEMCGPLEYNQLSPIGQPVSGSVFILEVEIEGKKYTGQGKNKKDAKKAVAMAAMKAIYNVVYPA